MAVSIRERELRVLTDFAATLDGLGDATARYWAEGFRSLRDRLATADDRDRRAVRLKIGRMLRGGMGSVNDLYSPDPQVDAAFRVTRREMGRTFGLGFWRSMVDDTLLGRASWYH